MMKKQKQAGITLIALVITIIVLLLLAGVALNAIIGNDSVIKNAEDAVGKYNNKVEDEKVVLNTIEKYLIEHLSGEVTLPDEEEDTNPPTVKVKTSPVTIEEQTENELSIYFDIDKNGNSEIKTITYVDTSNENASVENTKDLSVGTHIIKCTVIKENEQQAEDAVEIIVVEEGRMLLEGPTSVDTNGLATKDILIKPDANSNIQIVIPEGSAPAVLTGGTATNPTITGPGEDGSVASILAADQWENIATEQINKGIVIVDHAITYTNGVPDFNEYV